MYFLRICINQKFNSFSKSPYELLKEVSRDDGEGRSSE